MCAMPNRPQPCAARENCLISGYVRDIGKMCRTTSDFSYLGIRSGQESGSRLGFVGRFIVGRSSTASALHSFTCVIKCGFL